MNQLEAYINLNFLCLTLPKIKNLFSGAQCAAPDKFFNADDDTLKKAYGFNRELINKFHQIKKNNPAKREIEKCGKLGINVATIADESYPKNLKQIFDPPICFYYKGTLPSKKDLTIAVIGARRATPFGKVNAENISAGLASYGVIIASGMARGIDTHAHIGALKARGKTIAVLGCGLDIVYPPENKKLMNQISQTGAVISEFPLGTEPNPWNFPARNRIISGVSTAVIIVEAGEKSGSLITANCALEQGREVLAMPGNTLSAVAKGVNKLIKEGARLVERAEDVFEELGLDIKAITKSVDLSDLTAIEKKIYGLLAESTNIDDLSTKIKLPINTLSAALAIMESKGIIKKLPQNVYIRL